MVVLVGLYFVPKCEHSIETIMGVADQNTQNTLQWSIPFMSDFQKTVYFDHLCLIYCIVDREPHLKMFSILKALHGIACTQCK